MVPEYSPITDLIVSQRRMQAIASTQVEISPQQLYESFLDVMASRGGERWRQLDEIWLETSSHIRMVLVHTPISHDECETVSIGTIQPDNKSNNYSVQREIVGSGPIYELVEDDIEHDTYEVISNIGNLAPARLFSLLTDAHLYSPIEVFTDDAYGPLPTSI